MNRMKCMLAAMILLAPSLFAQQENMLSDQEKKDGWKLLFDGTTLNGWHTYGKTGISSAWKADKGTIHFDASDKSGGDGDIVTDKEYENFDLKLEWKISKNGNSGIMFDVKEDPKYKETYVTGPEMQVLDNDGHPDGKIKKHRAGDLYDLISSSSEPVKAVGEWNQVEIKCVKNKLDLYLNGINVVSTTLRDAEWDKLVQGSKFKSMPGFAKYSIGRIALQDHGNNVWFRNIRIKEL
ncbi:MAG TPA: DUF1080 domain-containing protein [Puia sp.]|nr:DUF1080 domain-containing protein [Puia sp.]